MKTKTFAAFVLPVLLAGCGGGGSSSSGGSSSGGSTAPDTRYGVLTVQWPARGRLIPSAANSLVATLRQNGQVVGTPQTIARPDGTSPTSTTRFANLAYGTYAIDVRAYPSTDGTGIAQGVGSGTMAVTEDAPGAATVSLSSTVARLAISTAAVDKGKALTLTASATDAAGNVVLLAAGGGTESLTWSIGSTATATVSGTGPTATLTGVHSGATTVTATLRTDDAGDVVSATAPVTVNAINDGTGTVTIK